MILRQLYAGGKLKALTMSYDDGVIEDRRLVEIFNRHGIKGTFHLNSGLSEGSERKIPAAEFASVYAGHEISCHSSHHPYLERIAAGSVVEEVLSDRRALEAVTGCPVTGMSYPFGTWNPQVIELLRACGIVYSRTTASHGSFRLPEDFLAWHPTCHHAHNALAKLEEFKANNRHLSLLYVWGHSYEFEFNKPDNNWGIIENFCAAAAGLSDVWYATNIEIYRYITAIRSVVTGVDGRLLYNPSAIPVWFDAEGTVVEVKAGETIRL